MRQGLIGRTSRIEAIDLSAISPAPSASRVLASDYSLDSGVMSLVSSSARVVYVASAGNLAVAAAKFGAAALSGSTAMLTEAIHSLVDSAGQLLLLTDGRRRCTSSCPEGRLHDRRQESGWPGEQCRSCGKWATALSEAQRVQAAVGCQHDLPACRNPSLRFSFGNGQEEA